MTLLQKLGVECSYDTYGTGELHYSISIDTEQLRYREQAIKYFTKIINAMSGDIFNKDKLGEPYHLTLSVNDKYIDDLQSITQKLLSTAKSHEQIIEDFNNIGIDSAFVRYPLIGCGILAGGLVGLVLSYNQMARWATDVAENMNYASHLLAPITGLTQTSITVMGTGTIAAVGAVGGAIGGMILSFPSVAIRTPLAGRVKIYQSLEEALYQARSSPKEEG